MLCKTDGLLFCDNNQSDVRHYIYYTATCHKTK